jgi:hypothetical protein
VNGFQQAREWFNWFQARPSTRKLYRAIPWNRIIDDPTPGLVDSSPFETEGSYFSLRIVEMHLQNSGEYFRQFLPVTVTLSEFTQGGQARALPFFLNTDRLRHALGGNGG